MPLTSVWKKQSTKLHELEMILVVSSEDLAVAVLGQWWMIDPVVEQVGDFE